MPNESLQSASTSRIAIAGSTGRVGAELTRLLTADPIIPVALTRRPDATGIAEGAEIAVIDFDRPETLASALSGADRLFLSHGTSARQVTNEIALIDAAVGAGVRHIVKLSALGPATRLNPFAWHMEIEAHLARQPVASTVLRPSAFPDILKRSAAEIATGEWAGAAGNGRVNFIDTADIARAARAALLEEVWPWSQRAYHLTGSRAWTMAEVAAELSAQLGRPVTYGHRSPEEQHAALLAGGLPPFVAELLLGLDQVFRESVLGETTSTVEALTGTPPKSLPQWLKENLAAFR